MSFYLHTKKRVLIRLFRTWYYGLSTCHIVLQEHIASPMILIHVTCAADFQILESMYEHYIISFNK